MAWTAPTTTALPPKSIENAPFFPAIDRTVFATGYRIPSELDGDTITEHLCLAMDNVNSQLAEYQTAREADGHATLADVPAAEIDGESVLLRQYRRAVSCYAKASLIPEARNILPKNADANDDNDIENIDNFETYAGQAISKITGKGVYTVELL